MPLYAYNKTAAPLALAAGNPIVTLPAASSAGARGKAYNVTGELQPNLTVDSTNGVAGGLNAASFALIQVQVAASQIELEWTTLQEYLTATLQVGSAVEVEQAVIKRYVNANASIGSDDNPGTSAQPFRTLAKAEASIPLAWERGAVIYMDEDGVGRVYDTPEQHLINLGGPTDSTKGTPLAIVGLGREIVMASQAAGGGTVRTLTGLTIANTTVTDNPLSSVATTVNVTSTTGFPTRGVVQVDSELISYNGVTATSFLNCVRGVLGPAVSHLVAAPIFLCLSGYSVRMTSGPSTTLSAALDTGFTTLVTILDAASTAPIDVKTTVGFPAAGRLRIDNEQIDYTGVTATSFTGITRAANGTAAAAHAPGSFVSNSVVAVASTAGFPASGTVYVDNEAITYAAVTGAAFTGCVRGGTLGQFVTSHASGALAEGGNRNVPRQIKTNTISTITLSTDAAVTYAAADVVQVERPSTQLDGDYWRVVHNFIGLKGLRMNITWGPASIAGGFFFGGVGVGVFATDVDVLLNGRIFFTTFNGTFWQNVGNSQVWAGMGADSPFNVRDDAMGVRFEGPGFVANRVGYLNSALVVALGATTSFNQGTSMRENSNWSQRGGSFTASEKSHVGMTGLSSSNKAIFEGCPIIAQSDAFLDMRQADCTLATGDAILARQNALVQLTNIGGSGNTGYGVETQSDAQVRVTDTTTDARGTLGDIKDGARPVRQWSDFNSGAPGSGLPSKNELDDPSFVARPFKLAFAGLTAAASFDLTTLAPFTTPNSASRGLAATTSVGGSFAIAGVIVTFTAPAPAVGTAFSAADIGTKITIAGATSGGNNGTFTILTAAGNVVTYTNAAGVTEGGAGTYAFTATSSIWANTPPAIGNASTLRVVTAGTAALGFRVLSDAGDTPTATVATISDDGKTVTFEGTVTAFTIEYTPVSGAATGAHIYQN